MEQKKTGKKALIVGIIAAIVILAALLVVLLTQCTGETREEATVAPTTTAPATPETYELYWNLDRAEYDGKSEAGMSSRMPESDGYFHIRFFKDGETVELRVADRKVVNAIDVQDLMGLEFDENGIVIGVWALDDLPCQKVGWQFYVQSAGGNLIKLNSAHTFVGMEILVELPDGFRIYDMTGLEGEIGMAVTPTPKDRVLTIADMEGNVTHMFVYSRPEFMRTFEAECRHCQKTVTWSQWTKTGSLPLDGGHYQLQNDITLTGQMSIHEDARICLDLNGFAVDGKDGTRMYSMHNAGVDLAIMDTSEGQTGTMRSHGEMNAQGGIIWVRFGAFYLYGGTLDGSDSVNLNNGAVMCLNKNTFAYINGGTIKGGTAKYMISTSTGKPTSGLGGNIQVSGKLVINDGLITGGTAVARVTYTNGKAAYARGYGGNIYMGTDGTLEINGGTVTNGTAGSSGGNIYIDGACDMTVNGGVISSGRLTNHDLNGGNLYVGSKAKLTVNGGIIRGGKVYNGGGNLYASGTVTMNGGQITGGKVIDKATGKEKSAVNNNVYIVNGSFKMYGGQITGGVCVTDSSTTDDRKATLALSGRATIYGAPEGSSNLTLSSSGEKVLIQVGTLRDGAKIGISTSRGVFTKPRDISEMEHFVSDIPGAEVLYYEGAYALGRLNCICGSQTHKNGCDGAELLWTPWTSTVSLPTATGNYYLTEDVTTSRQTTVSGDKDVKLDLNGHNVTLQVADSVYDGFRLYRADSGAKLAITDTTEKPGALRTRMPAAGTPFTGNIPKETVTDPVTGKETTVYYEGEEAQAQAEKLWADGNFGMLLWARGGEITVHAGILDGSNLSGSKDGMLVYVSSPAKEYAGRLVMYGGQLLGGKTTGNGNVYVSTGCEMELHGGSISGGEGGYAGNIYTNGKLTMTGGEVTGGTGGARNILTVNGELILSGGYADGGVTIDDRTADDGILTTLRLSGDPRITGASVNLKLATRGDGATVYVGEMKDGAQIGISGTAGIITEPCAAGSENYFTSDNNYMDVIHYDGALALGKLGCICGSDDHMAACDKQTRLWMPWVSSTTTLPTTTGYWYLTGPMKVTGQSSVQADQKVVLDLNGYAVTASGIERIYSVHYAGAELTITDTYTPDDTDAQRTGGVLKNTYGSGNLGGIILVRSDTKLTLLGGTLDASDYHSASSYGAPAVYVNSNATFRIYGGTVKGGTTTGNGGNIHVAQNGSLEMYGGTVTGGTATGNGGSIYLLGTMTLEDGTVKGGTATGNGGNIYVNAGGVMELQDGTVTGGKAAYGGNIFVGGKLAMSGGEVTGGTGSTRNILVINGEMALSGGYADGGVTIDDRTADDGILTTLHLSGDPRITGASVNLNLSTRGDGATVYVGEMKDGAQIGISGTAGIITEPCAAGSENYFTSDKNYLDVVHYDGALALGKLGCICGQETHLPGCDKAVHFWMPWDSSNTTLPTTTGYWYLTGTTTLTGAANIGADQKVVLDLNGCTATRNNGRIFSTDVSGSELIITDRTEKGAGKLVITGSSVDSGLGIYVRNGNATLLRGTLDAGKATTSHTSQGGIAVWINKGRTFKMYGGTVIGGTTTSNNGGAIEVSAGGTMELHGGTVYGSEAPSQALSGTAINVSGSLLMTGGTVDGGTTTGTGGSICVKGSMELQGGTVTGGTTTGNGGNIYITDSGSLLMTGGTVEKGSAKYGINIYVDGTMTMTGGTVQIGNILVLDGEMTLSGGKILGGLNVDDRSATDSIHTVLKLSGAPEVAGMTLLDRGDKLKLEVGELSAKIPITAPAGLFATVKAGVDPDKAAACFESRNDSLRVSRQADGLHMVDKNAVIHCLCGQMPHLPGCDGNEHEWQPWAKTNTKLPAETGYWYLEDSMTLEASTELPANAQVVLDLNGKTATRNGNRCFSVHNAGASLVITDSTKDGNGTLKVTGSSSNAGLAIYVRNGDATLIRGTLDVSGATSSNRTGGSAIWINQNRTFYMYGGSILGGSNTDASACGGAVCVGAAGAAMELHGGTISGGTITATGKGQCLYVIGTGSLTVTGGTIDGEVYADGTLSLSGTAKVKNLTANVDKFTVGILNEDAKVAITGTGVVAKNVETDVSAFFESTDGLSIVYDPTAKTLTAQ